MGSADLISQKRSWVITCHFNNVFYWLQAPAVASESNGGFNVNVESGGRDRKRRREKDITHPLHDVLVLHIHALDAVKVTLQCGWIAERSHFQCEITSPNGKLRRSHAL